MINEKFRERIPAWECFKTKSEEFAQFFHYVMLLCVEKFENHKLNHQEHTILLKFLDNCVNSLEHDLVRLQIQKVCSLPMWTSLCDNRREYELSKLAKLKKFWKAIEKSDAKLSESDRERVQFERTFLKSLIKRFLDVLKSDESEEIESGEIHDKKASKLNYLECFLELIIDLEALLPTRRFFNTLLEDTNLIIECDLWIQETKKKINEYVNEFLSTWVL
jgi:intron-binding protein aquarius